MLGLLFDVDSKSCWALAEQGGYAQPGAIHRLPRTACLDAEAVRDDVWDLLVEHLGHPDAVLVAERTRDLKKGV